MADDIESLVLSISADTRQISRVLKKLEGDVGSSTKKIENSFDRAGSRIGTSFARSLKGIGAAAIAGLSASVVADMAAEYVKLQNALRVTGLEGEQLESTFGTLFQIAQRQGTAIGPLVTLYSRLSLAQKELGVSGEQLTTFSEGVATALRVGGTSATEASGALLQLSQALGGGVVRAEEFNSVLEGAPTILQTVANGLAEAGGSVAKLRALVIDGKLSSEAFFNAFLAGMPALAAQSEKASGTVDQATNRIGNALLLLVGELDKTTGASKNAAAGLTGVASVIEGIPAYIKAAAQGFADLRGWLSDVGNNPFWEKLGKFMGVDYSPEGIAKNLGYTPPSKAGGIGSDRAAGGEAVAVTPVSIADFKAPTAKKDAKSKAPRRTADDRFNSDLQAIKDRTTALAEEQAMIGQGVAAQESRRLALQLDQQALADLREEARRKGEKDLESIQLTPDQVTAIQAVSNAYGQQAQALAQAEQAYGEIQGAGRDIAGGIVSDLRQGATAADALSNALDRVIDRLADMALNALFGGGGSGGFFSSLLGGGYSGGGIGHRAGGGPVQAGRAYMVGENGPEPFIPSVNGRVLPNHALGEGAGSSVYSPVYHIDARGADQAAVARLERGLADRDKAFGRNVQGIVRQTQVRKTRG